MNAREGTWLACLNIYSSERLERVLEVAVQSGKKKERDYMKTKRQ